LTENGKFNVPNSLLEYLLIQKGFDFRDDDTVVKMGSETREFHTRMIKTLEYRAKLDPLKISRSSSAIA